MQKLNFFGIGPKIALVALPSLLIGIVVTNYFQDIFCFPAAVFHVLRIIGIILLAIGVVFYALTAMLLIKGLKATQLMTKGPYYLCRNPLYSCFILMLIPGLAFVLNYWLILITSVAAYLIFKLTIKSEYAEMERIFGQAWITYFNETPELFPFPYKKLF